MSHFVYIYRDQSGKPRYVGYGESSARAFSHMTETHNVALEKLLRGNDLKLEIAGPFDSREMALAVETSLISALVPDANIARGKSVHRFRPVGVPEQYADRIALAPLSRADLIKVANHNGAQNILCVLIQNVDFVDVEGKIRRGYEPANPPTNEEIKERVIKWWSIRPKVVNWKKYPEQSPSLLLAMHGKPDSRFIIAAFHINRNGWQLNSENPSDVEIPVLETPELDALQLRGRRIDPEANLKFNLGGLILFPG